MHVTAVLFLLLLEVEDTENPVTVDAKSAQSARRGKKRISLFVPSGRLFYCFPGTSTAGTAVRGMPDPKKGPAGEGRKN
jgi:hypothetical protein